MNVPDYFKQMKGYDYYKEIAMAVVVIAIIFVLIFLTSILQQLMGG